MSVFVILCFILSGSVYASEPQCSRFHYEEQTLEKMIKLESFVQKIKSDLEEDKNQLKLNWEAKKESMKNDFNEMKEQHEAEKNELNEMKEHNDAEMLQHSEDIEKIKNVTHQRVLDTMQDLEKVPKQLKLDWETEKESMKNEFNEMKEHNDAEMLQHSEDIEKIKDSAVRPTTAFLAKDVTDLKPSSGHTFVFKTTMMNEGNGYDNTTGIFTAPGGGTYMFTAQFMINIDQYVYYAVVSDNNFIKRGLFYNKLNSCHNVDAITVLKPGGRVWVTCAYGSSSLSQGARYWNSFSGVLLHQ